MKLKNFLVSFACSTIVLSGVCLASSYSDIKIKINDEYALLHEKPFVEDKHLFVHIKDVTNSIGIDEINWDNKNKVAVIKDDDSVIAIPANDNRIYMNGTIININTDTVLKDNKLFIPIRNTSSEPEFSFSWESKDYNVDIDYPENTQNQNSYSEEDLYWLSRLVHAEAQSEPYEGKLAVANVIINRKSSDEFPNEIKDVIFDKNWGVQYTPTINGAIYNTPSSDSIRAAKEALCGKNNIGDALYFLNVNTATNNWIPQNRRYNSTISNHTFYY